MPGPPFGPSYLMTTTSPAATSLFNMRLTAVSWLSQTTAFPLNLRMLSSTPAVLTTQPS